MKEKEQSRLSRLTEILTLLQSKRIVTANELAKKFHVSARTIYRDMRTLEQSGIPVYTKEGKGYSLVEGYTLPPISLSEAEANALITAEQLILKNKDYSFVHYFQKALSKIKAVMRSGAKEKIELLAERIFIRSRPPQEQRSSVIIDIQIAITNFRLVELSYHSLNNEFSTRIIEPLGLYTTLQENWVLVAWCRLKKDYRAFRVDRMQEFSLLEEHYPPRKFNWQIYAEHCKAGMT